MTSQSAIGDVYVLLLLCVSLGLLTVHRGLIVVTSFSSMNNYAKINK